MIYDFANSQYNLQDIWMISTEHQKRHNYKHINKPNVLSIDQLMDMRNRGSIVRPVVKRLFPKTKQPNATKFMKQ